MRRKLTSNRRAFRSNNKSFLNVTTKTPIDITVEIDGQPVTIIVDTVTAVIRNSDELAEAGVDTDSGRRQDGNPLP